MVTQKIVKNAFRKVVTSHIYARGAAYYKNGKVKEFFSEEQEDQTITVIGKVKGGRTYRVILKFDTKDEEFGEITCTCPYGDVCKHAIALGLAFADSLEKKQFESLDKQQARKVLAQLGLSVEQLPDSLIESLLAYRLPQQKTKTQQYATTRRIFNPQEYFFTVQKYNGFIPIFHEKKYSYQQTSINRVLKRNDLTDAQRKLLTYIQEGEFLGRYDSPRPDPLILFPLLVESGFPIYDYYSYSNKQELTIDLHPQRLQAEIVYEPFVSYSDKNLVRHDFFLRIPSAYWSKNANPWYDNPFTVSGSCIVRDAKEENKFELHQATPLISTLFSRLEPVFEINSRKASFYQVRLKGEELAKFDQLINDASSLLDLTASPPAFVSQKATAIPQPSLLVDFNNTEQTLCIVPVIDYGIYQQDVSESVYLSRTYNGKKLRRRETFAHPGTHIITVVDKTIHHASIDEKQEIGMYKQLTKDALALGFTKTLKYQRKGNKQIAVFLSTDWPALSAYAKKKEYPILYTNDKLPTENELFRADFTTDLNSDNDWLYLDVEIYCGEERITIEKLFAFIESGERFWQKQDGTLVEIANREDLERLAKLLKNFHARENGGFEGRLHHTAELEYVMTSSKEYNAKRAKSFTQFLNRLHKGKPVKKVTLPTDIAPVLRPYQKEGIEWFYFLRSYRFAGILADDMGLGKTVQTLSILFMEKLSGKPSLVICPKTLLYNWQKEAGKFFPDLSVLVYDGTPQERKQKREQLTKYDVIITSYGMIKQDERVFITNNMQFNYAVLDESQYIKNHATKNAQIVKQVNADYRLALTGTPLENSVSELWSMFDFLMPGFLGNFEYFAKNFHKPIMDFGNKNILEHLRSKVEPFMLRRTKNEVLKELPPKIEQVSQCRLTEEQNVLYQQILLKVRGEVFDAIKKKGFQSAQIHILAGLTKLRQVCNHPALLLKDKNFRTYKSAKLDMCMQLVEEVIESGRKVLIFSQFTSMLVIISETLKERNVPYFYLSGKTKDRQGLVDSFNTDPSIPVFLISLKAGGTGLNLTAADTVIIFDPWWNPSVENQAIDRTHRIGQTNTVNVYRLLTMGTIEEKIQSLKQKKQLLFDSLINESGDTFKKLTWEDVKELFAE